MTSLHSRSSRGATFAAPRVRAAVSLVTMLWLGLAGAQDLQIIELRHRLADDVIPTLEPLLAPGGALTGMDDLLFVRTTPDNLAQIQQAVAMLDRTPRQLLISVGQGTVENLQEAGVRGAATIGSGDLRVGVNRPPVGDPAASVQARASTQQANLQNISHVRTLEGAETFIAVGRSAPVTTTQVTPGWASPSVVQTTEYRDASTGFYATARVSGDVVTLEISPRQQRFSGRSVQRTVETAGITTRVSGRLGEWMPVGGSHDTAGSSTNGLLVWGSSNRDAQYTVWVKVDEAP